MTEAQAVEIASLDGETVSSMELIAAAGMLGRALVRGRADLARVTAERDEWTKAAFRAGMIAGSITGSDVESYWLEAFEDYLQQIEEGQPR